MNRPSAASAACLIAPASTVGAASAWPCVSVMNGAYRTFTTIRAAGRPPAASSPPAPVGQFACGQFACGQFACGQFACGQFARGQFACGQFARNRLGQALDLPGHLGPVRDVLLEGDFAPV